ncbi:hypothetical protein HU200_000033 [Digitaria exilis]|uniref:Uncharacterized protein n=1 Tax=Digitaria exilis TaxID=1010633 RepID=A0A835KXK5_9POAL|nr:hypothetical protein HU200_000033 [Digitaria exilis]
MAEADEAAPLEFTPDVDRGGGLLGHRASSPLPPNVASITSARRYKKNNQWSLYEALLEGQRRSANGRWSAWLTLAKKAAVRAFASSTRRLLGVVLAHSSVGVVATSSCWANIMVDVGSQGGPDADPPLSVVGGGRAALSSLD